MVPPVWFLFQIWITLENANCRLTFQNYRQFGLTLLDNNVLIDKNQK